MPTDGFVTVSKKVWESVLDFWEEAMEDRFKEAHEWWGDRADEVIWPVYFPILKELALEGALTEMDPKVIIDNMIVNGEMVVKSEFRKGGNWEYYWQKYGGSWKALCDDALAFAKDPEKKGEAYALMRY